MAGPLGLGKSDNCGFRILGPGCLKGMADRVSGGRGSPGGGSHIIAPRRTYQTAKWGEQVQEQVLAT